MFSIENIEKTREIIIARGGAVLADGREVGRVSAEEADELFETVCADRAEVLGRGGSFPSVMLT